MTHDDQDQRIESLQQQLSEARAWAWSEYHGWYDGRWLATREVPTEDGGWDWLIPERLSTGVEPPSQPWTVALPGATSLSGP
ncbi:hypothetical protein [Terrabacter sp. 2YAF2]|uniref:hypothetical protein n=1 Tax=Terrabacter sp. 2YAF2 TaxID=3233026 RepID=UPI003F9A0393